MATLDLATLLVKLRMDSSGFTNETKKASAETKSLSRSLTDSLISVAAIEKGMQAAKAAFDFGKEGAAIVKLEGAFDSLAESVGTTADVLIGELRGATAGMVADSDLMASANRFLAMNLATTGEEAAKLSEIAVRLGTAFGRDATTSMEEFALMLANQSIPRLDTFGIAAGEVRNRIQELQAATPGLSREMAFMQAVMEQAEISMGRLGDGIPTDAFTEFEVAQKNLTDALKVMAAEGLTPILEFFTSGLQVAQDIIKSYGEQTEGMIQNNIKNAESMDDLVEAGQRIKTTYLDIGGVGRMITGTNAEMEAGFLATVQAIAENSRNMGEYEDAIRAVIGEEDLLIAGIGILDGEVTTYTRSIFEAAHTTNDYSESLEVLARMGREAALGIEEVTTSTIEQVQAAYDASVAHDAFQDKIVQTNSHLSDEEAALVAANAAHTANNQALLEGRDAQEAYNQAVADFNANLKSAFLAALEDTSGGIGFFNESMEQLGSHSAFVSNATSQQADDLERLQDAYDDAAGKIHDYEIGLTGANLTDEERAEKIQEQQEIMAGLAPTIEQLNSLGGEYVSWTTEATINQDAVNEALFNSIAANTDNAAAVAIAAGALGIWSEEAVNAALQSALIQSKIDELAPSFDGTAESALAIRDQVMGFIESLQGLGPAAEGASGAVSTATATLSEHDAKLAEKLGVFDEQATTAAGNAETAFGDIEAAADAHMPAAASIVDENAQAILTSVQESMEGTVTAVGVNLEEAVTTADGYVVQFGAIGTNIGQTMAAKLLAEGGALSNVAAQIVSDALAAAEAAAEIQSPSVRAIHLSEEIVNGLIIGLMSGQTSLEEIAQMIIDGTFNEIKDGIVTGAVDVNEAIEDVIDGMFDTVQDSLSAGRRIGGAADFFAHMLVDPAEAALDALDDKLGGLGDTIDQQVADLMDTIADQHGGFLPDIFGDLLSDFSPEDLAENFDAILKAATEAGDQELVNNLMTYRRLQEERNLAEKEYLAQQEKLLVLQEQQQQLAFLQNQLDLIEQLQQAGLNPAAVLEGITLGLDASAEDLLAASQAAMAALIQQANLQLGQAQGAIFGTIGTTAGGDTPGVIGISPDGGPLFFGGGPANIQGGGGTTIEIHGNIYGWDDFADKVHQALGPLGIKINLMSRL